MAKYSISVQTALPSRELKERVLRPRLWLVLFLSVCVLQQVYQWVVLPQESRLRKTSKPVGDLRLLRHPASYTKIFEYEVSKSISFTLMQISWESSDRRLQFSDVCHFQNLCVENYRGSRLAGRQKYWLAADAEDNTGDPMSRRDTVAAEKAFGRCFNRQTAPKFSLKPLLRDPKHIKWMQGHTLGLIKSEVSMHPFAWFNVWSQLLGVVATVPEMLAGFGISRPSFFSQVVLFEQALDLNDWASAMKDAFIAAVREALPGGLDHDISQSMDSRHISYYHESLARQPAYFHHGHFSRQTSGQTATCFESVTVSALSGKPFFRNQIDAVHFKKWSFARARLEPRIAIPCVKEKLKTVVLLRNDRPLWNISGMVAIMEEEGLRNISFATITAATSYRDQHMFWNDADIVISVHGAQLTNSFFMTPHAAVVEVFMPDYYNDSFEQLAAVSKISYVKLLSSNLVSKEIVAAEQPGKLQAWEAMHRIMQQYPDPAECFRLPECRQSARHIGAIVDPTAFRKAIAQIISETITRQECPR